MIRVIQYRYWEDFRRLGTYQYVCFKSLFNTIALLYEVRCSKTAWCVLLLIVLFVAWKISNTRTVRIADFVQTRANETQRNKDSERLADFRRYGASMSLGYDLW